MLQIAVIVPDRPRGWQRLLTERLAAAGHRLSITAGVDDVESPEQRLLLGLERRLLRNHGTMTVEAERPASRDGPEPHLQIDLTGKLDKFTGPTMQLAFDANLSNSAALMALAAGRLPDIDVLLDGRGFDHAAPMPDSRIFVARAADDVFARAVTLMLRAVDRFEQGARAATPFVLSRSLPSFGTAYLAHAAPRIAREAVRRARYRFAHWRVGYRLTDRPGVAETTEIGDGWTVLPDDGSRFYADPFPLKHDGKHYIFVEDYPHDTRKAVISVSVLDRHGVAGTPVPVLEEPHHLSYPQVFEHAGEVWMLPEGSGSRKLTLYRASRFPDKWEPAAVLLEGEISDATLLRRDDGFWLFATDRDGGVGSTSDTLVVFHAPALTGPWSPHKCNPILIDRRRARPGGAFIRSGDDIVLPIQDGTLGYGGGLGLSRITRLDQDRVELSDPSPVSPAGDFPYPQIHTLNRAGRLEVIDGIAAVRKR